MIGYRAFRLSRNDGRLSGLFHGGDWRPGLNTASCQDYTPCGSAPGPACFCGYWCFGSELAVTRYLTPSGGLWIPRVSGNPVTVIGQIETYGRHIEHELGTRCEKAQITALYRDSCLRWPPDSQRSLTAAGPPRPPPLIDVEASLLRASLRYDVPLS